MAATEGNNPEVLSFLIHKGLDINAKTKHGITALMLAAWRGKLKATEHLVDNGADINAKDNQYCAALWYANMFEHGREVANI